MDATALRVANSDVPSSVEEYFRRLSQDASRAQREVRILSSALGRLQKSLETGDAASIAKATSDVASAGESVQREVLLSTSFRMSVIERAFEGDQYLAEVASLAKDRGLSGVRATEGRLFAYPYVVERKKSGLALLIGSRTLKGIRPAAVVDALVEARKRAEQTDLRALLSAVEKCYDFLIMGRETNFVPIEDVYDLLTALPGSASSLPFLDFLASLDTMRRNGSVTTKRGRTLDFPAPSTTGKGGKAFRVIREDGREQLYHMLRFLSPDRT